MITLKLNDFKIGMFYNLSSTYEYIFNILKYIHYDFKYCNHYEYEGKVIRFTFELIHHNADDFTTYLCIYE